MYIVCNYLYAIHLICIHYLKSLSAESKCTCIKCHVCCNIACTRPLQSVLETWSIKDLAALPSPYLLIPPKKVPVSIGQVALRSNQISSPHFLVKAHASVYMFVCVCACASRRQNPQVLWKLNLKFVEMSTRFWLNPHAFGSKSIFFWLKSRLFLGKSPFFVI